MPCEKYGFAGNRPPAALEPAHSEKTSENE